MSEEQQSALAADLLKEVSTLSIKYLLVAYGAFLITLFTTVSGLEEGHWLILPLSKALNILYWGVFFLIGGIMSYIGGLFFVGTDYMSKVNASPKKKIPRYKHKFFFYSTYFYFAGSCVVLLITLDYITDKLVGSFSLFD